MGGSNAKLEAEKRAREQAERQLQRSREEQRVREEELERLRNDKREREAKEHHEKELAICRKEREKVKSLLSSEDRRRVNVLVVGLPGSGKSTLITSMQCCVTLEFDEVAAAGRLAGGESVTPTVRCHKLFKSDRNLSHCPADFYDMPGLHNTADEVTKRRLRAVLKGQVKLNNLNNAMYANLDIDEDTTSECDESQKIDRMIFVHSCTVDTPENLAKIVVELGKELDIFLFSVLSHIDQEERTTLEELELAVGTKGSPRTIALELFHNQHAHIGNIEEACESNNMLYKLWRAILNQNYTIHSTKCEKRGM